MRSHSCPKCHSGMTEGYIVAEKGNMPHVSGWSEGPPDKRWWGLKRSGKPIEIATWRCQRCGFLESYART